MKQVYLLIIALLFPVSMWADDVTIPLYDTSKGGTDAADQTVGSKDERSLSFAPEASHDGHTVSIYSYVPMEEIQISVLDEVGNVVYEDTVAGNCSFIRFRCWTKSGTWCMKTRWPEIVPLP